MSRVIGFFLLPLFLSATKYAGEFQELGVGARICGMGGAGVVQGVDPSVIYFNPAGTYYIERSLLLMHGENFAGLVKNDFGAVVSARSHTSFGGAVQYVAVDGIKLTRLPDSLFPVGNGNRPIAYDTVGTKDIVFYINGARGNEHLALGANIKIFHRNLNVITGMGGGLDLGFIARTASFRFGVSLRDFILAPIIWSNGTRETVATKFSLGVAPTIPIKKFNSRITLELDLIKYLDYEGFALNTGLEFAFRELVYGRAGSNGGRFTIGAGISYKRFYLDYAFTTHSDLHGSNKISAGLKF